MKTFFTLLKVGLNLNFGISALKYRFTKEKKRLWEPILIGISAVIGIASIAFMFSFFMFVVFSLGQKMGQPEIVLTIAMVASQLIILFFGIVYVMGTFYFSKDLSLLIPLPLKASHILGSKFLIVMVNEYLTLIPLLAPALIIFGAGTGQGVLYSIKAVIVLLVTPAIPLAVGSIFIMLLMRFVNIRKSKDLLAVLGGVFGIVIAVGINVAVQSIPKGSEEQFFNNLLTGKMKIAEIIGQKFPPAEWAANSLSMQGFEGLGYLLLFAGVSVLLFIILLWLGNRIFYRSILAGEEVVRKRKALSKAELDKRYSRVSSPVKALFFREWKLFIRTPIFVLNGIAGMLIAPVLLLMPFLTGNTEGLDLLALTADPQYVLPISLGGLGMMLLVANANIVANTSLSREGSLFWISKLIPVSPKQQVLAKLLHSMAVELIGILVTAVVLVVVLKFSLLRVAILIVLGILGSVLLGSLNLMVDVVKPKLEWTSAQEAVKRNMNSFLGFLVTFFILGVLMGIGVLLFVLGASEWAAYAVLGIVMIVLSIPAVIGLFALAEYKYKRIDI